MSLRGVLVALIVVATAAFVTGVAIERGQEPGHGAAAERTEAAKRTEAAEHGEAAEDAGAESRSGAPASHSAEHAEELRPLGIDVEAWPFVALAAAASLALAAAAVARPRAVALLLVVAAAMLAFAALDVREVVHQLDEDRTALTILAAAVAALHLAAAAVALAMRTRPLSAAGPPAVRRSESRPSSDNGANLTVL
jgi:hypothetical protein